MNTKYLDRKNVVNPAGEIANISLINLSTKNELIEKYGVKNAFESKYCSIQILNNDTLIEGKFYNGEALLFDNYDQWMLTQDCEDFEAAGFLFDADYKLYYGFILRSAKFIKEIFKTKTTVKIDKYPDPLYSVYQIEENGAYIYLLDTGYFNSAMWYPNEENFKEFLNFIRQ